MIPQSQTSPGLAAKQAGQLQALKNAGPEWVEAVLMAFTRFVLRRKDSGKPEFTFETFRQQATEEGIPAPHHHNAWGAIPRIAVKAGMIEDTGKFRPAFSRATHHHPVRVWRVV